MARQGEFAFYRSRVILTYFTTKYKAHHIPLFSLIYKSRSAKNCYIGCRFLDRSFVIWKIEFLRWYVFFIRLIFGEIFWTFFYMFWDITVKILDMCNVSYDGINGVSFYSERYSIFGATICFCFILIFGLRLWLGSVWVFRNHELSSSWK